MRLTQGRTVIVFHYQYDGDSAFHTEQFVFKTRKQLDTQVRKFFEGIPQKIRAGVKKTVLPQINEILCKDYENLESKDSLEKIVSIRRKLKQSI